MLGAPRGSSLKDLKKKKKGISTSMNAALFCANTFASFGRHDGERVNRIGSISSVGRNRLPVKVYPVSQPSLESVAMLSSSWEREGTRGKSERKRRKKKKIAASR